jgi:hypothetical protein
MSASTHGTQRVALTVPMGEVDENPALGLYAYSGNDRPPPPLGNDISSAAEKVW